MGFGAILLASSAVLVLLATVFASTALASVKVKTINKWARRERSYRDEAGPVASGRSWSTDFSTGNFHQWTWWGQGQQSIWGDIAVVNAAHVGVPDVIPGDAHIARMTVAPDGPAEGKINAKLYKGFGHYSDGTEHEPSDVSGTYSAWYYIPSGYRVPLNTGSNIFQFKEEYALSDGSDQSDPLWWVQLGSASWAEGLRRAKWIDRRPTRPDQPVAFLNFAGNNWTRRVMFDAVPLNRWFDITAVVHQGNRTVYTIDGKQFDVARASQYPVSPFHPTGREWVFGVGNYGTAPGTTLYVGAASYQRNITASTGKFGPGRTSVVSRDGGRAGAGTVRSRRRWAAQRQAGSHSLSRPMLSCGP